MIYSRCKCGKDEQWGSGMAPATCDPCDDCGTVPASHPDYHPLPTPHDFSLRDNANCPCLKDETVPESVRDAHHPPRCRTCYRTKAEIERRAAKRKERKEQK